MPICLHRAFTVYNTRARRPSYSEVRWSFPRPSTVTETASQPA